MHLNILFFFLLSLHFENLSEICLAISYQIITLILCLQKIENIAMKIKKKDVCVN